MSLQGLLVDPVCTADGHTYERCAITSWLKHSDISPVTDEALEHKTLIPNISLKQAIREFGYGKVEAETPVLKFAAL